MSGNCNIFCLGEPMTRALNMDNIYVFQPVIKLSPWYGRLQVISFGCLVKSANTFGYFWGATLSAYGQKRLYPFRAMFGSNMFKNIYIYILYFNPTTTGARNFHNNICFWGHVFVHNWCVYMPMPCFMVLICDLPSCYFGVLAYTKES